jgi:hypothetical protein
MFQLQFSSFLSQRPQKFNKGNSSINGVRGVPAVETIKRKFPRRYELLHGFEQKRSI